MSMPIEEGVKPEYSGTIDCFKKSARVSIVTSSETFLAMSLVARECILLLVFAWCDLNLPEG